MGGQSRASATTSRIFSNHQWARLERLRAWRDALMPGRFSRPICSWRLIRRYLPLGLGADRRRTARHRPKRQARHVAYADASAPARRGHNEIMRNSNLIHKHSTKLGTSQRASVSLRL